MEIPEGTAGPPYESLLALQQWSRTSFQRLSRLAGEDEARRLVDALVSECLGRRLDEIPPQRFVNGLNPDYAELREFFQRFAPEVVHYLPRSELPAASMERLREIHRAICSRIASDCPATLGRYGRTLLSREWKAMDAELAYRMEASWKLAHIPGGEQTEAECRSELETLLAKEFGSLDDPRAVLELRTVARKSICSSRFPALPTDH